MTGPDPVEVPLHTLGVSITLRLSGAGLEELYAAVPAAWSRCRTEPDPGDASGPEPETIDVVLDPAEEVGAAARAGGGVGGTRLEQVMDALSPAVTIRAINAQAGALTMLHAGALADPATGRTVALVAPSGTGKTTAARTLAARFGYVTDETTAVTAEGVVLPHPKPLSLVVPDSPWKQQVSPDDLGLGATPAQCRLAAVVLLRRDQSADPWLEPVATLPALAALAPESSYLARMDRPLHQLAALLHATGGLSVLHYREAGDLHDVLSGLVGSKGA